MVIFVQEIPQQIRESVNQPWNPAKEGKRAVSVSMENLGREPATSVGSSRVMAPGPTGERLWDNRRGMKDLLYA